MPLETDLYDLLGVPPNASEADIKKAYRRKAKEHHPDKNINDPEAAAKFQEMAAAYEILSDSNTRTIYDTEGVDGLSGRGGPGGMDAADIFTQFFGGGGPGMDFGFEFGFGGPGGSRRRQKGEDSVITYDVTLEDLYNGKHVKMSMEKDVLCGTCKGTGAKGSAKPKPCVKCEGKGWTIISSHVGPSRVGSSRVICPECDGEGEKLREKDRCKKCKGEKTVKEKTRTEIYVERGMADRQRIVLAGAGDQQPGVPAGDVVFVLKATPHASFERSGNDLLAHVTITLSEALLGFNRILLTHLDGRGIHVESPPGHVLEHGKTIVVRGEGMPVHKHPDAKGNLYVLFEVEMPDAQWLAQVDKKVLETLLPPKKPDLDPRPEIVDEAPYEETDTVDFGETEDDWEDEDEEDDEDDYMGGRGEPECRTQ